VVTENTSALGNLESLRLDRAPRRVVSLVPSVTESLFDLGVGDRLVGITDYCIHPASKVTGLLKIGGTKNPDLKKIKAALPDLIIANQEENRKEDVEALQAEGFKVWVTFPRTMREAIDLLWATIRVFRVPMIGQRLSVLETTYEWASLAAENMTPVSVFCPIWREPRAGEGRVRWWMTINRDTYTHDVLRVCGGANVFADRDRRYPLAADLGQTRAVATDPERDRRYPRVTPEEVAERAPEVILLPSEPYPFDEADLAAFAAFPEIPAVKNNRLHLVDGSLFTWPGTRLALALADLPALLQASPTQTYEPLEGTL
jgi:ABC-type Fe3+-hydroxamate transport system substrate-binding protein